nr:immunoglobulin light chain junction region [Macaca mulatta]MOW72822.1 immunoglobulin light chain junction region [Macaca mulatta]MOW72836.1 immunoglobulin light chain junction region [Macaca mulatta]MOW72870.1 immunoglobulin light chain junction region [Macaca mulatta]MOW72891.1 immunoglobulin light chain junction region [Macaca mulatta]
CMQGIQLPYTC